VAYGGHDVYVNSQPDWWYPSYGKRTAKRITIAVMKTEKPKPTTHIGR
jgi:hypothetical protein